MARATAAALLALLTMFEARADGPCEGDGPGSLNGKTEPRAACDADQIEMARACHCLAPGNERREWGPSPDLTLEMPAAWHVTSGRWTNIPFTLRYQGQTPAELDFPGGAVVYAKEIQRGKKPVEGPPCAELRMMPAAVRLTLRAGAAVRGTIAWKASNYQSARGSFRPTSRTWHEGS